MSRLIDGPSTSYFQPVLLEGNLRWDAVSAERGFSEEMVKAAAFAPRGDAVGWGLPFQIGDPLLVKDAPVEVTVDRLRAGWLVFMHTLDLQPLEPGPGGLISPMRGEGRLNELAAEYVVYYADGSEERISIRKRMQVGTFTRVWGENCFNAVAAHKPQPVRGAQEQLQPRWGVTQTRENPHDDDPWTNWLFAWKNPHPDKEIRALRFEPRGAALVISAVSAGSFGEGGGGSAAVGAPMEAGAAGGSPDGGLPADDTPLRWQTRRKALLTLPEGMTFAPDLDEDGLLAQIRLDMGQVISAQPRLIYPGEGWTSTYANQLPEVSVREVVVEYTAHPQARFHLWDGRQIPVSDLAVEAVEETEEAGEAVTEAVQTVTDQVEMATGEVKTSTKGNQTVTSAAGSGQLPVLQPVAPSTHRVTLRVVERGSGQRVAVKLHIHGEVGEYLAPVDRHRILNPYWFEDYSVDFMHRWIYPSTYIPGETVIDLPLGRVYVEVTKGFEIRPVRKVVEIGPETEELVVEVEKALPWREHGWVTADTHVHFLSPGTAMLEGAGEGVNVINLLASQWGELMTSVGDFDGHTTWGAGENAGPQNDGEYLVRVGTENRQHVLGHISLLGYRGRIIAPMTTGGPDEAALGDPVEILLTEWARQCRKQGGLVVLPHFPNPRAEHAASIISGEIDAVEMTSWGNLYAGIDPYSLSDWYRYLNCGYRVAAVGGTDKMSADTAVGTVRTYARVAKDQPFSYDAWMDAVRRAETFVTYGPLLEFNVDGQTMGARISLSHTGGTLDVTWQVASVSLPTTRVELVINGEIRESVPVGPEGGQGSWRVRVERSSWLALLVRGRYPDQVEMIAAHSSPVMVDVEGTQLLAAADALTILEQIEGTLVYLDTIGTRAEDRAYKRMRLVLEGSYRQLHNRMHQQGYDHGHHLISEG